MLKTMLGYSMGTWLGAIVAFIALPVATYFYSKEELGKINYYFSIINIAFSFILLGLDQAYIRYFFEYSDKNKRSIFTFNIIFTICFTVSLSLVNCLFNYALSEIIIGEDILYFEIIISLHVIALTIVRYFQLLYRFNGMVFYFTIVSVLNTILFKVIYLGGVFISTVAKDAVLFSSIASLVISVILVAFNKKCFGSILNIKKDILREEFIYAIPVLPTILVAVLNNYLPVFFLKKYVSYSEVALYSIAITIGSIITLVHNGLNTYFEPFVFKNYHTEVAEIRKINILIVDIIIFLSFSLVLVQEIVLKIYNKTYSSASTIVPFLIYAALFYGISDFISIGIKIEKKMTYNIFIYLVGFISNFILCYLFVPSYGLIGTAIAVLLSSMCLNSVRMYIGNKFFNIMTFESRYFVIFCLAVSTCVCNILIYNSLVKYMLLFLIWSISAYYLHIPSYTSIILKKIGGVKNCKKSC